MKLNYKILPRWHDTTVVFETFFAKEKNSFWLDSSMKSYTDRFSYMGSPDEIYSYFLTKNRTKIQTKETTKFVSQDIFSFLDTKLKKTKIETQLPFDFAGGFVGYFGYELKALTDSSKIHSSRYPDSVWYLIKRFITFDHFEKKVYLVCLSEDKKSANEWFGKILARLETHNENCYPKQREGSNETLQPSLKMTPKYTFSHSKRHYLKTIQRCKKFLEKGESYQICLTNTITTEAAIDPFILYKLLRTNNPAPYAAFLKYDDLAILSSSPEQFLKINRDKTVQTKPIKGTIKRGKTLAEDQKLKKALKESTKDWSENAMIVDLLRNDLGKVCEFGSVKVTKNMDIESYQTVHQLVSTIVGKMRNDVSVIECIKACFPGGSMTGAPKIRTMEILNQLEKQARGIYSGSLGFLSFNQTAELSIVIRTIITNKNELSIGAGGAILINSDPQKEYDEMLLKTKVLIETIEKVYTTPMQTVYLALGSNVGNKKKYIKQAIEHLGRHVSNIKMAKLYETEPMYFKEQENFTNTVAKGRTSLSPLELLAFVKNAERDLGRQERFQNGPREIDIDILFYNQLIYESDGLIIPHPKISEREFVLQPFADLDPDFMHPVLNKTIKELLTALRNKR